MTNSSDTSCVYWLHYGIAAILGQRELADVLRTSETSVISYSSSCRSILRDLYLYQYRWVNILSAHETYVSLIAEIVSVIRRMLTL